MKNISLNDFMNQRKPFSHLAFFIFSILVSLIVFFSGKYQDHPSDAIDIFIMIFVQIEVFVFFGNMLFARLNFNKSPGEITRIVIVRFSFFLAICLLVSMILYLAVQYLAYIIRGDDVSGIFAEFIHSGIKEWFRSTISGLSAGAIIFIILLWQSSLKREQRLREENLIFQNETLKNQVNPHFLFNSLNTLSSLIITQPDLAEVFINRLSSIYRYILENGTKDRVPVEVELSFIKDYFFLHRIRDDKKIQLEIQAEGLEKYEILPVSLQILVENAIKHNKATRESPLMISIYIENRNIVVRNNLQKMAVTLPSTQIGLKNLAQRVNLVTGKALIIEETLSDFIVKIPLL
jgi:two-component system LytT family sensor kinase